MKTIAVFNNRVGSGNTLLVQHLAAMFARLGVRVLAVDLDPQVGLSTRYLDEYRLAELWLDGEASGSLLGAMDQAVSGQRAACPHLEDIDDYLALIVGDPGLARLEWESFSAEGVNLCQRGVELSRALGSILANAARSHGAEVVLLDLGPGLGVWNRSALAVAEYLTMPLAADIVVLQALEQLGHALESWRRDWLRYWPKAAETNLSGSDRRAEPVGYAFLWHAVRFDLPVSASERWIKQIPKAYRAALGTEESAVATRVADDSQCLGSIQNFRVLHALAEEVRKPMFLLRPGDGALGSFSDAVQSCGKQFRAVTRQLARRAAIELPEFSRNEP